MSARPSSVLRVGLLAGEASGDILGAGLMAALRQRHPDIQFEGIGGPRMIAEGLESMYEMERLSIMGLIEPLKRLPELLAMRRGLKRHFLANPPDLFVGIDSPDFNLGLELGLRKAGITTAHYVSPSVWAWRQGRIRKIKRAVDLMLTLFPFEAGFYQQHQQPVVFVGHPLADKFPLQPDNRLDRLHFGLQDSDRCLAVLPGSRRSELDYMGELFLRAVARLLERYADLKVLIPAANSDRLAQLQVMLEGLRGELPVLAERLELVDGDSQRVLNASDLALLTSGTVTLEAMLLKKPMVVAYRMSPFTYRLLSPFIKVPHIALPNLLAEERLVPELIQDELSQEALIEALDTYLSSPTASASLQARFTEIHRQLRLDASGQAAAALMALVGRARP